MRSSTQRPLIEPGQEVISQGRSYIVTSVLDYSAKPDICGQPLHHGKALKNNTRFLGKDYCLTDC